MTVIMETKKIRKEGDKWLVTDSSGKKILGRHDTRKEALEQLQAIEVSKKKNFTYSSKIERIETKDGQTYVIGPISTDEVDGIKDKVELVCLEDMKNQILEGSVKLDIDHEVWRDEEPGRLQPIGKAVDAWIEKVGNIHKLMVKWLLNKSHPRFKEIVAQIKDGFYDAFSIAFQPVEAVKNAVTEIRHLFKVILENVGLTAYPMNKGCTGAAVVTKSLDYMEQTNLLQNKNFKETETMTEDPTAGKGDPVPPTEGGTPSKIEGKDKNPPTPAKDESQEEILQELKAMRQILEEKDKDPSGTDDEKDLLTQVKCLEEKILGDEDFKHVAEKKAQEDKDKKIEEIEKTLKNILKVINEPAKPPAGDPQMPDKKTTSDQKGRVDQKNWSPLQMIS